MIRQALSSDIPALVQLGAVFHARSPWSEIAYEPAAMDRALQGLVAHDAVLVAEVDERIVGMIGLIHAPIYFSSTAALVQEAFWWCEDPRQAFQLVEAAEAWARARGALRFVMARLEGLRDAALDRLYRSKGFARLEHTYAKDLT